MDPALATRTVGPTDGVSGVTVIIVGLGQTSSRPKLLYGGDTVRECEGIGPYLVPNQLEAVLKANEPLGEQAKMLFGNMPRDGGHLFLSAEEAQKLRADRTVAHMVRTFVGSEELINGKLRFCLWIEADEFEHAKANPFIADRLEKVAANRLESPAQSTKDFAARPSCSPTLGRQGSRRSS